MKLRLKPWQWALAGVLFVCYVVWATWGVYGGFYIGYPPYTPAYLNATRRTIVRTVNLERTTRLHVFGEARVGNINVTVDGRTAAQLVGRFDRGIIVPAGHHVIRFENLESAGWINYRLE